MSFGWIPFVGNLVSRLDKLDKEKCEVNATIARRHPRKGLKSSKEKPLISVQERLLREELDERGRRPRCQSVMDSGKTCCRRATKKPQPPLSP